MEALETTSSLAAQRIAAQTGTTVTMNKRLTCPKTILVVDDEPMVTSLLEEVLSQEGYNIVKASDGSQALEQTLKIIPDLILLDVIMPVLNGYQVCEQIRLTPNLPYIPIVFLTATHVDQQDISHGLEIGGDDFVRKPIDTMELLSRIQAALRVKGIYDELALTKAELSRYVSLSTLRMIEKSHADENVKSGETLDVTVMFSDIRGFTHIAENTNPIEVFEMLNLSISKQIKIIEQHNGIVDKINGDEIMAIFAGEQEMASNALRCALDIVDNLCGPQYSHIAHWVGVGIGINTGPVFMGSIGSETLKNYTVVGNTVNVAARLCGVAQKFQILFTEKTAAHLKDMDFNFRSIGKVSLKGLRTPSEIFELKQ